MEMDLCQSLLLAGFASTVHVTDTITECKLESPLAIERAHASESYEESTSGRLVLFRGKLVVVVYSFCIHSD